MGADQLLPYVKRLSKITDTYTSVHPNAGLPNAFGVYDQTATEMSELIENYLKENIINIVGFYIGWWGCVLGAANDMSYLGPTLMLVFLIAHFYLFVSSKQEIHLVLIISVSSTHLTLPTKRIV
mgnify:CR=1 FL=1